MADIEIPLAPVYSEPAGKPKDVVKTSYGQALAAQTRNIVAAPINQFNYFCKFISS